MKCNTFLCRERKERNTPVGVDVLDAPKNTKPFTKPYRDGKGRPQSVGTGVLDCPFVRLPFIVFIGVDVLDDPNLPDEEHIHAKDARVVLYI